MHAFAFGFPRLGTRREYKALLEGFWSGQLSPAEFSEGIAQLKLQRAAAYAAMDLIPCNELSLYDPMLDTAVMVGAIPERFGAYTGPETYFAMARGKAALELTKWFNTNYHYLVPELQQPEFHLLQNFPLEDLRFHRSQGIEAVPTLIGPYTFLRLSKRVRGGGAPPSPLTTEELALFGEALCSVYARIVHELSQENPSCIVLHEPALALDVPEAHWELVHAWYAQLAAQGAPLWVLCYYDSVADYRRYVELPVAGLGLDLVSNEENRRWLAQHGFPPEKVLLAGVVNGRQVWATDLEAVCNELEPLAANLPKLVVAPSCPLYHLPVTVAHEQRLPLELRQRLAFAQERIEELRLLRDALSGDPHARTQCRERSRLLAHPFARNEAVRERLRALTPRDFQREPDVATRAQLQRERLRLPLLPTTTIGSFPQTAELRRLRAAYRRGECSEEEYRAAIQERIRHAIALQEELGLDVLVHGEFERSDMVEYFAERLEGIAITDHGWVLSYGSRVYRPPIIYGDVSRPAAMTLAEITFAQSLTRKPVKGMLTGPVTLLLWSYWRQDIPAEELAYELALCIADEVRDLENAGIGVIQIDEPAFREGAPLKRHKWGEYFRWAVRAFRLATAHARPQTQIHTHMCYSEFNDITEHIAAMDFDVISIEGSRSKGEIVESVATLAAQQRQIGVGVYDVHSPAIPTVEEIQSILRRILSVLPSEAVWVNPDCGLKTRRWEEVIPALRNMMTAARELARTMVPTPAR
jgi:5-methyltetrahydropteroyltriglutamate--homocysteine methyltransferase